MRKEKKEYLSLYLIQESKINRLKQMILINPSRAEEYKAQITKAVTLRKEIEAKIKKVDNGILSEILFRKYVCGKTLEEISYLLNYSKRHIERLHLAALDKFKL